jgi:hypothetical protein
MRKIVDSWDAVPWVDIYSERCFGGQLIRLRASSEIEGGIYEVKKLPRFGSIIVGPSTIAEFVRRGNSKPIRLSPRTVIPDVSHLTEKMRFHGICVVSARR